ncbi:alpha/beta hydrolase [Kordiimonas aquimaris]|uniref:alpha/beta hydrolase n=1 Tax=Kordiimonas aquimaris TaxID=707591 RepID=UPI0021CFD3F7|nr:alpha/beta fold hydrolase [Kordiimonas aquimaris]
MHQLSVSIAFLFIVFSLSAHAADYDPVTQDPVVDPENPPHVVELQIESDGYMMNGHLYVANGAGPHPTIVFLHGFPGNEKNLDLAQTMRRAGFNTLYFHYRGAWGSEGEYSATHLIEDAAAAVKYLEDEGRAGKNRIDPNRISLIGHSLGGFTALVASIENPQIQCTVALAPANSYPRAAQITDLDALPDTFVPGLKNYSYADLVRQILADKARFDFVPRMGAYKSRPLLLISGLQDTVLPMETQVPIAEAAQKAKAAHFEHVTFDAGHSFSSHRIGLMKHVSSWMGAHCK